MSAYRRLSLALGIGPDVTADAAVDAAIECVGRLRRLDAAFRVLKGKAGESSIQTVTISASELYRLVESTYPPEQAPTVTDDDVRRAICTYYNWEVEYAAAQFVHSVVEGDSFSNRIRRVLENFARGG